MPVSAQDTIANAVRPVIEAGRGAAVLCDVDGTLAPIVGRAEDAHVPAETARVLGALSRRYGLVACVSGRAAQDARRIVGVGGITYIGSHGAEVIRAGRSVAEVLPAFASWRDQVWRFARAHDTKEMRVLRVRIEDKGPIVAFHWRGAPDEDAARTALEGLAQEAEAQSLQTHWGRKVLEVRPPVAIDKGIAISDLLRRSNCRVALFGGDDATDVDGFEALDSLVTEGELDAAVRVGVVSDEAPPGIVERADITVAGVRGYLEVLELLASPG